LIERLVAAKKDGFERNVALRHDPSPGPIHLIDPAGRDIDPDFHFVDRDGISLIDGA
jgi:hypothetical protein